MKCVGFVMTFDLVRNELVEGRKCLLELLEKTDTLHKVILYSKKVFAGSFS